MIPNLQPLKQSVSSWIVLASVVNTLVAVGLFILLYFYIGLDVIVSSFTSIAVFFVISTICAELISRKSVSATDILAKSVLIGIEKNKDVDLPNTKESPKMVKDFITRLSKQIIDAGSLVDKQDSEQMELLHFFQKTINILPAPIIIVDPKHIVTYANESALKYLELPTDRVIGQYFYDACNLSFVSDHTLESWLSGCRTGSVVDNESWERVRLNLPDNRRKQFDLAAHYQKDESSNIELVLVMFDRTLHYERDDHDLSFVALAVHELRTPLTIMRGYIEVFEDELKNSLTSEQATFMNNMAASAQRLSSFVSNILNVARVEENALTLRLKEDNWPQVLTQACKDMQLRATVHDKNIRLEIDQTIPTVAVDKVSIYEVMNNLLDNAVKYTHTKEEIVVKTYEKNGMIETTVTDKGVGISSSIINHVFDKFYRAHNSKNSVGGTGLGLYLCRAIITAHGGQVWVQSKEGQGSTFGFTLPIYKNIANELNNKDNKEIVRGAHGWIKNHTLYRG
ncbi:MAG: ATP-binding protein [Patescibacteria group bacterium]|jgi:two-component system phosphate regulon sensor histidine kinase PhoR/two-component system sensor histidine kinase VicK|nr:ATP-binding protein [Patescibacteria group bacterium]